MHWLDRLLTHPRSFPLRPEWQLLGVEQRAIIGWKVGVFKQPVRRKTLPSQLFIILNWYSCTQLARGRRLWKLKQRAH